MRNPDVTVRSRGVMEKCTYCVQRINHARIDAKREDAQDPRRRDRDRLPGGLPVRRDRVRRPQRSEQPGREAEGAAAQLRVLEDLNTRPRTTYLAALRNPNPELESTAAHSTTEH